MFYEALAAELPGTPPLPSACSSVVYDGLFAMARQLVRQGKSNAEIQDLVDGGRLRLRRARRLGFTK